jgi:hypothetical protein
MGDAIDWEPPVLTLEPAPPTPYYVRQGAVLSGTVTDNISVDRVILRDATTGEELFRATITGGRWEIVMDFIEDDNNRKIMAQVIAYDRAGNTGEQSMVAVTLIVDIGPPIIDDMWIQRTDIRAADLETYNVLKALETQDPSGERSGNANRYQNGWFYIDGTVAETETRIDIVSLNIYDERDPDTALLELGKLDTSNNYKPRWLVSEEALLAAGEEQWPGYTASYRNGERYYYRVTVTAYDRSENESEYHENFYLEDLRVEEQGFFCMWQNADRPKGPLDPSVRVSAAGTKTNPVVVQKGSTLPVEFFDDDRLLWAYTGLLTIEQWNGLDELVVANRKQIAPGVTIPAGTDAEKLQWLRDRLRNNTGTAAEVYNWRYDRYSTETQTNNKIIDEVDGKAIDEKLVYVQTGSQEKDNGEYVLFSLVADKKLPPHPESGDANYKDIVTNKTWENPSLWYVNVIDENEPLIVFDVVNTLTDPTYDINMPNPPNNSTSPGDSYVVAKHPGGRVLEPKGLAYRTGDSPEDNTFPKLTGGQLFEINGYTLRLDNTNATENSVSKFRMAWIPFNVPGGPDSYIPQVQDALKSLSYPAGGTGGSMAALEALGVQHWNFTVKNDAAAAGTKEDGVLLTGTTQTVGTDNYRKQVFRKTFNVLGDTTDTKGYRHFTVNNTLENETKLFIIYVEDGMGHIVFRQLRILGNKTPPNLTVYDITGREVTLIQTPRLLPNLNNDVKSSPTDSVWDNNYYFFAQSGNIEQNGRDRYKNSLVLYQPQGYMSIVNSNAHQGLTDSERTEPYTPYPRDTVIKYWVEAAKSGDLNVNSIKMFDITYSTNTVNVGEFNAGANALSYVEMLPEVTQRVFLFEATDTLNNVARIQRTVAVTNAARLESITTTTQDGSYGIGTTITLQANFSNLVRWTGTNPPLLNVRYTENGNERIRQIATKTAANTAALSLDFDFVVSQGDTGSLKTMYSNIDNGSGLQGDDNYRNNRPITLPSGTQILDATRGDTAFTPGNVPGFNWTWAASGNGKSLQGKKAITLDGIRPTIQSFVFNSTTGKTQYTDANNGYFFKADDTLTFTLTASKSIFTNGTPIIQFQMGNTWRDSVPWQSSSSATAMVFSVQVPQANTAIPEGAVTGIRLKDVRTIVDSVGNTFAAATTETPYTTNMNISTGNNTIRIDKTPPAAPFTRIGGFDVPLSASKGNNYFNTTPNIVITANPADATAAAVIQYSLNNGVLWNTYDSTQPSPTIVNGQHTVVTRYTDRAGNLGALTTQAVQVNAKFPDLKSITAVQTDGFYPRDGNRLEFILSFDDAVYTADTANATITLTNRNASNSHNTGGVTDTIGGVNYQSFTKLLTATNVTQANASTTIRFEWTGITTSTGKEMLNGLYVSAVNFTGLSDRYGNPGGSGTATITGTTPSNLSITIPNVVPPAYPNNTCTNLSGEGLKVDCIAPRVTTYNPVNEGVIPTGTPITNKNRTITLTFNERMSKGSGTITVRPRGNYAIPAVFENNGYYLGTNGIRYSNPSAVTTAGVYTTYVDGFYDIYNKTTTAQQRTRLTQGDDMSKLTLNERTGNSAGPYKRTTHGLVEGAGYTGDYGNATGANGPNPTAGRMIPDTSTKWVLDYRYLINDTTANSAVTNIRTTLTAIKFRWQEIDVTSGNVSISTTGANAGQVVTINLPEPVLDGLQWDLYYPAGTFTDESGNNAPAIASAAYWFWSSGVQAPVVRVNRRSFDARTSDWQSTNRAYNVPGNTTDWNTDTITITDANGWGITDFNVVHYRIETETPEATLWRGVYRGTNANNGAVNGAWTGTVAAANGDVTPINAANWNTTTATNGTWVLPNLIRRAGVNATPLSYTVIENGVTVTRAQSSGADYQGLRSYNQDPTKATLDNTTAVPISQFTAANRQGRIEYSNSYEASKSYIVAEARRPGTAYTAKSYEGVFRSVVMYNQNTSGGWYGTPPTSNGNRMALVEGSNIKNGMPSIAGFPLRDAEETGDNRFIKVFHYTATGLHFWVSTEIVSQWYMLSYGSTHQQTGEINNYLSAGYGDLTYSYNQR